MNNSQSKNGARRRGGMAYKKQGLTMGILSGLLLIAAGVIAVMHNTGVVSHYIYGILFSWQMLLIVLGVFSALANHYWSGLLTAGVGVFYMLPEFSGAGTEWMSVYWPLILVFFGIFVIVKLLVPKRRHGHQHGAAADRRTENGFVNIESRMGGYEHIVLDERFEGANIACTLGGVVLDLRHTAIGAGEIYIDIRGTLAGIEIYAPEDWVIVSEINFVLGGVDDKRRCISPDTAPGRYLVLRGSMTLGGIEIKS